MSDKVADIVVNPIGLTNKPHIKFIDTQYTAQQWADALMSGNYIRARHTLGSGSEPQCCLGVLRSEVAKHDGVTLTSNMSDQALWKVPEWFATEQEALRVIVRLQIHDIKNLALRYGYPNIAYSISSQRHRRDYYLLDSQDERSALIYEFIRMLKIYGNYDEFILAIRGNIAELKLHKLSSANDSKEDIPEVWRICSGDLPGPVLNAIASEFENVKIF